MSTATLNAVETENAPPQLPAVLHFMEGLQPFASTLQFDLTCVEDAPPFMRMDCTGKDLAYILVDPFAVCEHYRPDVPDADLKSIGLKDGELPLMLAIVNIRRGVENATLNLAGPLLIHPRTGRAKQTVLLNATTYSCRHRLGS